VRQGWQAGMIDVDYASHGPAIDEITDELAGALAGIQPAGGHTPFYSTVTGTRTCELDTGYWIANLRQPVRFADAVGGVLGDGYRVLVEVGAHPVVVAGVEGGIDGGGGGAGGVGCGRADRGGGAPRWGGGGGGRPRRASTALGPVVPPPIRRPASSTCPPTPSNASASGRSRRARPAAIQPNSG